MASSNIDDAALATTTAIAPDPAAGAVHQLDAPEGGFLVLADISGFTAFTTTTELEHGAAVIGTLLADVMGALAPPLEIQELEGDAVFALGADRVLPSEAPLLETFRRAYGSFRDRQKEMEGDFSCACRACTSVGSLSLKLVTHHGTFVRQSVGGRSRVAGPDVILVHRLLKNGVGGGAYALFTEAALERLAMDPIAGDVRPVTERYPYFGEVTCFVVALDASTDDGRRDPLPAIWDVAAARN